MSSTLVVHSSPSPRSRIATIVDAVCTHASRFGRPAAALDLRSLPSSALLVGDREHPTVRGAHRLLADADAVVTVTPAHNGSVAPLLRAWLDVLPPVGLRGRTVQPVGLGAVRGQSTGLDYVLGPTFAKHGASVVLPASFLLDHSFEPTGTGWSLQPWARRGLLRALDAVVTSGPALPVAS